MNFKEYFLIKEAYFDVYQLKTFADLPENPPYGFWVTPTGELFVAEDRMSHTTVGEEIIKNNYLNEYKEMQGRFNNATRFLYYHKKWGRIVIDDNNVLYLDVYQDRYTARQKKTAEDIASFYGCMLEYGK